MGNAAGCATTNSVQPQQNSHDRYKDNDVPQDVGKSATTTIAHQERSTRDEKAQSTLVQPISNIKDEAEEKKEDTTSSNEAFESSVIVEIPKGKSLRYITCKDLHQDKETDLMRVLYRMDEVIAYNTHQLMESDFMFCVFSNVDKNIVIYSLSDGLDKFYYHIRDAESIHQDKFMVFEDSPSNEKEQLSLFILSVQNCVLNSELTIEPQPDESIEVFQKLKNDVGKVITIALHLYPLKHNIDINIRDTFMMITKYSKLQKQKFDSEKKDDLERQHSLELKLKQESEKNLTVEVLHLSSQRSSNQDVNEEEDGFLGDDIKKIEDDPHTPITPEDLAPPSQPITASVSNDHHSKGGATSSNLTELISSLKAHENDEVRQLVSRIELILTDPTATNSTKSPLASLLVSKASSHNMGVKSTVKDILISDEHDSETQKWLSSEVLHGSLVEDSTDLSWKKRIKAYTKALVFTNYLKEMSSIGRKSAKDSLAIVPKDDIPLKVKEYLKENLLDYFKFDVFEFNKIAEGEPLYYTCLYIFQTFDLIGPLNIPIGTLKKFLKQVESNYFNNPYHNNCHATDVVQTAISLYVKCFSHTSPSSPHSPQSQSQSTQSQSQSSQSIQFNNFTLENNLNFNLVPLDILALVVACLAHDVCHPGVTNLFEKKTRSEKAIMFNDRSILENFHCYNLFKILGKEEFNIFVNMSSNQYEYLRELIVEMILATDISQHFLIVGQIKSNDIFNKEKFSIERKECLLALLKVIIKCADVSNPTKSYQVYGKWVNRVMTEFYNQGDTERNLKIDISPFMDRNTQNVPKCQTGFIEFIVMPLFNLLFDFKPEETELIKKQIQSNHLTMQDLTKSTQLTLPLVLEHVHQQTGLNIIQYEENYKIIKTNRDDSPLNDVHEIDDTKKEHHIVKAEDTKHQDITIEQPPHNDNEEKNDSSLEHSNHNTTTTEHKHSDPLEEEDL
ncbi:3'5'-cyclic nucleotide phosphodiesterase family protein [Naegleria gruberi]|uniref:Phosphodiesterase n=1 Tax=Naegleria gruberi TaxID=5762 RepID=D2V5S9_NAEGR|nr:3'5'-cyclic nucleotide phosphodiesterase family protein [Naegleria gruberi]EFC47848.1 3'5'-cyclic nucleotide phosphodiesterase family protein [Naegleria gruberi]|eukprot:XP_002680592.1 3'5'-cyclic nucleotide phosphodiesterase family protein [Naegleria gruberi strain NEG-M]